MNLYKQSTIRDIKDKYDFHMTKSLGQNFITDKNIIDKIIEESDIDERDLVIEIGPGMGTLTREAAKKAGKVVAVEIDRNLIPILSETLSDMDNIEIINGDILKTDLRKILEENPGYDKVRILGNLPYYITTPIIMKILEEGVKADSITVMMQKEVADRIKSEPGNKTYGALSVAVQYYCTVKQVALVPKEVFMPRPKVDSAILRLDIRGKKPVELLDEKQFFACIKAGFGKRRKTLLNALTGIGQLDKEEINEILKRAGVDPIRRAETLDLSEFAKIANEIAKRG